MRESQVVHLCDFCGKSQHDNEVEYLIAGPDADICDKCVALCVQIIEEKKGKESSHA